LKKQDSSRIDNALINQNQRQIDKNLEVMQTFVKREENDGEGEKEERENDLYWLLQLFKIHKQKHIHGTNLNLILNINLIYIN